MLPGVVDKHGLSQCSQKCTALFRCCEGKECVMHRLSPAARLIPDLRALVATHYQKRGPEWGGGGARKNRLSQPPSEPVLEDLDTQGMAWEALSSLAAFIPASVGPP